MVLVALGARGTFAGRRGNRGVPFKQNGYEVRMFRGDVQKVLEELARSSPLIQRPGLRVQ